MMARRFFSVTLVLLMVIVGGAASGQEVAKATSDRDRPPELEEYRIGPEDVLHVSVWKNDALSRSVPVRPDGMISLPLVDDVQAAGLTPLELRDALVKKLTEYIPQPEVSVIVQEVRSFKVSVLGEVVRPGRFELRSRTTVLDVLAQAGGFGPFASRSRIVILRPEARGVRSIPFNYNRLMSEGKEENLYLRPGDIVVVP